MRSLNSQAAKKEKKESVKALERKEKEFARAQEEHEAQLQEAQAQAQAAKEAKCVSSSLSNFHCISIGNRHYSPF